jgi:hypothetical protein
MPNATARYIHTEDNNRQRTLEPVAGGVTSAGSRLRSRPSIQPAKAAYGLLGPLPRARTTAQFLLPFFCASKKGSRRKGEKQK